MQAKTVKNNVYLHPVV